MAQFELKERKVRRRKNPGISIGERLYNLSKKKKEQVNNDQMKFMKRRCLKSVNNFFKVDSQNAN